MVPDPTMVRTPDALIGWVGVIPSSCQVAWVMWMSTLARVEEPP